MNKLRKHTVEDREEKPKADRKSGRGKLATRASRVPRLMLGVLNGSFLTREKLLGNMPFILFSAALMIAYIAYGYRTERVVRDLDRTEEELNELRSEYITIRAHLEKREQQSQVAAGISGLGLKESRVPPAKLEVSKERYTPKAR